MEARAKNYKRLIHATFNTEIPTEQATFAQQLANEFIQWLTTQGDVYLRQGPTIRTTTNLSFRLSIDKKNEPGQIFSSNCAYEEIEDA